jgi:hypothetical protein
LPGRRHFDNEGPIANLLAGLYLAIGGEVREIFNQTEAPAFRNPSCGGGSDTAAKRDLVHSVRAFS